MQPIPFLIIICTHTIEEPRLKVSLITGSMNVLMLTKGCFCGRPIKLLGTLSPRGFCLLRASSQYSSSP